MGPAGGQWGGLGRARASQKPVADTWGIHNIYSAKANAWATDPSSAIERLAV